MVWANHVGPAPVYRFFVLYPEKYARSRGAEITTDTSYTIKIVVPGWLTRVKIQQRIKKYQRTNGCEYVIVIMQSA
jgi:hypothetical protein